MGNPKQLLDFHGKPLLRHTSLVAQCSGCRPIVVVLGFREQEFRSTLVGLDVEVVVNETWAEGMGRSIQTGLKAIETREVVGAILALADQPFVTADFLRSLVTNHYQTQKPIVASRYSATVGVPAFFSREAFPQLLALAPDRGCKSVILSNPSETLLVDCPDAARDIDTLEDYLRALTD